jgi:hypothetical protein
MAMKEEKIMAEQILVALESQDRLNQLIPYIETVVQPGMKVVFLVRFAPNDILTGPEDNRTTLEPVEDVQFLGDLEELRFTDGKMKATHAFEDRSLSAEHKAFLALDTLLRRGIEIAVDVYTGSLSRVLRRYTRKGNVRLIMKRAGKAMTAVRLLSRIFSFLGLFKEPALSPVLLLLPHQAV